MSATLKPSSSSSDTLMDGFTQTIGGQAVSSPTTFDVIDPNLAVPFAVCPDATREQLDDAVAAARAAFPAWRDASWETRGDCLKRLAAAMLERMEELATLITREQGKPLIESRLEIQRSANNLMGYAEQRVDSVVLRDDEQELAVEHHHAAGVAAVISPWNSPISLFVLRTSPFLQSGSTVIAKPSPYTPLTTMRLGEIARDIFPPGVVNVIAGNDPLGQWMTEHPGIDRVSFTGSVRTGKRVMASAAGTLKRVGLELGGNDPAIVLDDADVESVAPRILAAALRNCGQICMAIKRLYVPDALYEPMVEALSRHAKAVKVGNGLDEGVQVGPLQNRMQFDIVTSILRDTETIPGVRIATGSKPSDSPGYFVAPTIVSDIPEEARLVVEEQFGPVMPVLRYSDLDDAIARANKTSFGLGASVWSSNPERAAKVAVQLQAGSVWVNDHMVLNVDVPFGGWRESGIGRGNGQVGLISCLETNVVRVFKQKN